MKRTDYETLAMEEIIVDVEGGFLSASVAEHTKSGTVKTAGHELNEIDVTEEDWNDLVDIGQGAGSNGWK
jgi:hypothetical protein